MDGQKIVSTCASIIKRQDVDRTQLLFLINTVRRGIFRDKYNYRLVKEATDLVPMDGIVTVTGLKNPFYVEFQLDDDKVRLFKLNSYENAITLYQDINVAGVPAHYLITENNNMRVIPMPPDGTINVYGEFYPDDLLDNATSEDILAREIPEVLIYLGTAEYYDMLFEHDKAKYWRDKGMTLMDQYMKEIRRQQTDSMKMMARDPWGNRGLIGGNQETATTATIDITELDGGEW